MKFNAPTLLSFHNNNSTSKRTLDSWSWKHAMRVERKWVSKFLAWNLESLHAYKKTLDDNVCAFLFPSFAFEPTTTNYWACSENCNASSGLNVQWTLELFHSWHWLADIGFVILHFCLTRLVMMLSHFSASLFLHHLCHDRVVSGDETFFLWRERISKCCRVLSTEWENAFMEDQKDEIEWSCENTGFNEKYAPSSLKNIEWSGITNESQFCRVKALTKILWNGAR